MKQEKIILHVDLDAFYASVEQLDHPEYRGKPVMVGGVSQRGVIAACSYEARAYGVHSAMSAHLARKKCPHGYFVRVRMDRYQEVSRQVFKILYRVTDQIQKMSIDEAYLDVTNINRDPLFIAQWIQRQVFEQIGITISVGISYNKFLAKLASEWNKPAGIFHIHQHDIPQLLQPLPIIKIHGLGHKTASKMNRLGIHTIGDLLTCNLATLNYFIGETRGKEIYDRIRGIDNRPLEVSNQRKSYGRETTFSNDTTDKEFIKDMLRQFLFELTFKLVKQNHLAKTVSIKIKYEDFEQITRSHTLNAYTNNMQSFEDSMIQLIDQLHPKKKIRLAGVSLSNITSGDQYQLSLFDANNDIK